MQSDFGSQSSDHWPSQICALRLTKIGNEHIIYPWAGPMKLQEDLLAAAILEVENHVKST